VLVALAVVVAVAGARRSGQRPFAVAFAIAMVTVSAGFVLMLWTEHTFAYVPL
jgi:dipeptide/tripeptide permease